MKYSSFKLRLIATLIDWSLYFMLFAALVYYVASRSALSQIVPAVLISVIILLNPVILFLYDLVTYYFGGSPGKLITGQRVVGLDGKRLSFWRIMFRQSVGYMFSSVFFGLGYLSVIKDEKKQAWHDRAAGSYVINTGNMFIIGCMLFLLSLIISGALLRNAVKVFNNGPLPAQIKAIQKKSETKKPNKIQKPNYTTGNPEALGQVLPEIDKITSILGI